MDKKIVLIVGGIFNKLFGGGIKGVTLSKDFNVVIEGTYYGHNSEFNFELAQIDIPKDIGVLNDGEKKYMLYGKTEFFESIIPVKEKNNLELNVGPFYKHGLLVLGNSVQIPLEARALCTRDGRIYLEENLSQSFYRSTVSDFVKMSGEFFNSKEFSKVYKDNTC